MEARNFRLPPVSLPFFQDTCPVGLAPTPLTCSSEQVPLHLSCGGAQHVTVGAHAAYTTGRQDTEQGQSVHVPRTAEPGVDPSLDAPAQAAFGSWSVLPSHGSTTKNSFQVSQPDTENEKCQRSISSLMREPASRHRWLEQGFRKVGAHVSERGCWVGHKTG